MAKAQEFIDDIVQSIKDKKEQRQSLLDQLSLIDVEIDKIDELIINIDKDIPPLIDEINVKIQAYSDAYQARIDGGCRSDLKWVHIGTVDWGDEDAEEYEAQFVPDGVVGVLTGKYSVKYFQTPKNRDYGSALIHTFRGNIGVNSSVIAVTAGALEAGFDKIKIGDEITDDLDAPAVFPVGNFPKVIGFGRTDTLTGVTTSITGEIAQGSNQLYNTGIGTDVDIPVGSGIALTSVLPEKTRITAISYGNKTVNDIQVDASKPSGFKAVEKIKVVPIYELSHDAIAAVSNTNFTVGIGTSVASILLQGDGDGESHLLSQIDGYDKDYFAIRSAESPDADFDFNKFPQDPVRIANITASRVGVGHSVWFVDDDSEYTTYPEGPITWWSNKKATFPGGLPRRAVEDLKKGPDPFDEETMTLHPEPKQGGGSLRVPIGVTVWPCIVDADGDVESAVSASRYVTEGTTVYTTGGAPALPTTTDRPSTTGNCTALTAAIDVATTEMEAIKAKNSPKIKKLVAMTAALRSHRDEKEIRAWGLLQGAAYVRSDIQKLEERLNEIRDEDFSAYES